MRRLFVLLPAAMLAIAPTALAQVPLPADPAAASTLLGAELTRSATPELLELLAEPRESVRARAFLSLGRVGLPALLPLLIEGTRDPSEAVRLAAATALGQLDYELELQAELSARDRAAEALARLLDDPIDRVAVAAAAAFGRVGRRPEALDAWLASQAAGAASEVLAAAVHARGLLGGDSVGPLAVLASSSDAAVLQAVAVALGTTDDPARAPLLDRLIDHDDPEVRIAALRALRFAPARNAAARTERSLRFGDWREQCAALEWSAAAWQREGEGSIDDGAFAAVLRRSLDRNPNVRGCALRALASAPSRAVAIDRLLEALAESDPAIRATAAAALARLGEPVVAAATERVEGRGADDTGDPERAAYVRLRARAGALDAEALAGLVTTAGPATAVAALEELERRPGGAAWSAARAAVREGGVMVARAAPAVLGRLAALQERDEERAAAADELWARMRDDADLAVRAAAFDALVRVAPELVERRVTALPELLPAVLRRRAFVRLASDTRSGARVRADPAPWLAGEAPWPGMDATIDRVLELRDAAPELQLVGPRGDLSFRLRFDTAPIAALRLLEALEAGEIALEVGPGADHATLGAEVITDRGRVETAEVWTGALPVGAVILPAPGLADPAVRPDLRVVLVAGPRAAAARVGRIDAPGRVAGRWQPGDRLVLRRVDGAAGEPPANGRGVR